MNEDQPSIAALSDEFIEQRAALDPVMATFWGIPGHDGRWNDLSPDGWDERLSLLQRTLRATDGLTPRTHDERVALDVLRERVQVDIDMIASGESPAMLSNLDGHHTALRDIFEFMPRHDDDAWRAIRARLEGLPDALRQLRQNYEACARRGLYASRSQALVCADQCAAWAAPDGCFAGIVNGSPIGDLTPQARRAAEAFGAFSRWLRDEYAATAREHDGIGRDRYALHARVHNGVELDLDETYLWGWDELARISSRIDAITDELHPGTTRAECVARVASDARYVLSDGEAFIRWSQEVIDRTFDELDGQLFDIPAPLRECRSMPIPSDGVADAYYTPPSEDFSRPGMVWHAVAGRTQIALWEALTTLYHEGVPGHHLQLGHMMYRASDLTRFQRLGVFVSAHGEGWALYAERLMHELGFLEDPVYELGWLANQALRAVRVVVDIGLHCDMRIPADQPFHPGERWTAEVATQIVSANSAYDLAGARAQVDRYLGMPAQAISYKVGERVWLAGRERARRRLGDAFDLKQFHMEALAKGAMGLDQLSAELDLIGT